MSFFFFHPMNISVLLLAKPCMNYVGLNTGAHCERNSLHSAAAMQMGEKPNCRIIVEEFVALLA